MPSINATIRLRPVRFAFLVSPTDKSSLAKIFQINTCLWGGKFNPIIPVIKRVPPWWNRHHRSFETRSQILNGYVDFFEPDFLVEAEAGIGDEFGFEQDRVIALDDILLRSTDRSERGRGLDVFDLYRNLYEKEYQFARRHVHGILHAKATKKAMGAFTACLFGDFPMQTEHAHFKRAFFDAFDPKQIELDGAALASLYTDGGRSALTVGHSKIEVNYTDRSDPALFVLDAHKPVDLIDFWNLRIVKRNVLAIPLQWAEELSGFAKQFIAQNYRPLPDNSNGVMIQPTVQFARSIATPDIEKIFDKHFRVDINGANCIEAGYPSLWQLSTDHFSQPSVPILTAESKSVEVDVDLEKPDIHLDAIHPKFASRYGQNDRWMNVITLHDWSLSYQVATCFPTDCRKTAPARHSLSVEGIRFTTEGFVVPCQSISLPHFWRVFDGTRAFQEWLKNEDIKAVPSSAGQATHQIVRRLGGLRGVYSIAHGEIVKLLESVSRRPQSRCIHNKEFRNKIKDATKGNIWRGREFRSLVEQKVVELGLELRCTKCSSWSWQALDELNYSIECGLCMQPFNFPITDPSNGQHSRWSYRLVGPFALPDYARGGYAAALSLRFFAVALGFFGGLKMTWSTGQELDFGADGKIEADFMFWYQRLRGLPSRDHPTLTVFGESKSFGKEAFEQVDVDRMKQLAMRFPGSVCVFSTMKEASDFSQSERERLRKFTAWGRERIRGKRGSRAPVIVLTGAELFTAHNLNSTWEELGGKHAEFVSRGWTRTENLHTLADLTQQLYLDMDSYSDFLSSKWEKRRARSSGP